MRQNSEVVLSAVDATVSPQRSGVLDTSQVYALSAIIASSSGSNAGTLKLQGSNDITGSQRNTFTPANWADVTAATVTVASGAVATFTVTSLCYSWVRFVWTPTSGVGTITVTVNTQGF
jgi:hypothetical protein